MTVMLGLTHNQSLLLIAGAAVVGLVFLITKFKLNAFVALVLASLFVGLCSGMKLADIGKGLQDGVGGVLGSIAVVVGLGTILGKMLAESGGAERIATTLITALGEKHLHWAMMLIGFVVGIPVFFGVGLVLLVPILFTVAKRTSMPFLQLGLPLLCGLAVAHNLIPPHPGIMVAIEVLKADVGKTILYSFLIGLPTAAVCGPILGQIIARHVEPPAPGGIGEQLANAPQREHLPGFWITLFTILLPVLLMLLAMVADVTLPKENQFRQWCDFLGHPNVALLLATLFSFWSFGSACGFNREQIGKFAESCLGPVATILLVVGGGGGFNKILILSGVGGAIADVAKDLPISPLLLGWLLSAGIRVAVGSATVAITTAAGIMAPIVAAVPGVNLELLVLSLGAGSGFLSHVNDGGFWFVKEYFNQTVSQSLRSWSVMVSCKAVVAMIFVLLLEAVLK